MKLYLSIVFVAMILISTLNIWLGTPVFCYSPWWVIGMVVIGVVFEIAVDGIFAKLVNISPDKWYSQDKKFFKVSKKERNFYEKIKIRSWKDKVLELGALGGFRKNKLADPTSPEYLQKFLFESGKGVVVHIGGMILGFLVIFIFPLKYALVIGLPIAIVNVFLNILSTMVLRYNTPKLLVAFERAKRTQALAQKKAEEEKADKKTNVEVAEEKAEAAKNEEQASVNEEQASANDKSVDKQTDSNDENK